MGRSRPRPPGRSLGLALYLLAAARPAAETAPPLPPRGEGRLVWLHCDAGTPLGSLAQLASRMERERPGGAFLVTAAEAAPDLAGFPRQSLSLRLPADRLAPVRAALDHFRPSALVLTGFALPPALVHEAHARGVPLILADARPPAPSGWARFVAGGRIRALLRRFDLILARDPEAADELRRLGGRTVPVTVTGQIEETTEALPHNEAEREALAHLLRARPVWLAAGCPPAEEEAVLEAHAHAMRYAHRMLLILAPSDPARGAALAERLDRGQWMVALRSREEEPEEEVSVFIADGEGEMGLWYRLAPVSYMGGTLSGGAGRNPYEPAALGSAVLHGPEAGPYPAAYARLGAARAARKVRDAAELAEAVADLIAPDKAAQLAHNAWQVSSGGAEVAERVVQLIFGRIDAAEAGAAAEAAAALPAAGAAGTPG